MLAKYIVKSFLFSAICLLFLQAPPAHSDAVNDWKRQLIARITEAHIYPHSAIRRELEGSALIKITIYRSGAIKEYSIIEPSGEDVLDNIIPNIIKQLDPLPTPPSSLPDSNLTLIIPLTWRIQ